MVYLNVYSEKLFYFFRPDKYNYLFLCTPHKCCSFLCGKQKTKPIVISLQKLGVVMKQNNEPKKDDIDPRIQKVADKLKELRIGKGYSSHENFAWDNNLNRVQYWRIEKGSNITLKTLLSILDIHKITLSEFFNKLD